MNKYSYTKELYEHPRIENFLFGNYVEAFAGLSMEKTDHEVVNRLLIAWRLFERGLMQMHSIFPLMEEALMLLQELIANDPSNTTVVTDPK